MLKNFKSLISNNRVIIENFSFLGILQVSNLIVFFITIPFLIRVLGKELYGLVVFAQTIAIYFSIIINYGFNSSGTRDISINRNDRQMISKIVSTILSLKFLIFLISIVLLLFLILVIPFLRANPLIFLFSMLYCLSEALFPGWYFQGMERMKYITFINVSTRLASALSIFLLIKKPEHYIFVPIILGIGTNLGSLTGLYILFRVHGHRIYLVRFSEMVESVKSNFPLFISNVSSHIYVNANKLIVGSFLGMKEIASYDVADRVVNLLKVPVFLVGQTLFPRISQTRNLKFLKVAVFVVMLFFLVVYISVLSFSPIIVKFFLGTESIETVKLLHILAITILPISFSLIFAELILVPFGFFSDYAKMRSWALMLYFLLAGFLIMTRMVWLTQLAIVLIIVETFVVVYSYFVCRKNKII